MNDEMDINWCLFGDGDHEAMYWSRYPLYNIPAVMYEIPPGRVINIHHGEPMIERIGMHMLIPTFDDVKSMEDWVTEFLDTTPDGLKSFIYDQLHKRGERIEYARDRIEKYKKEIHAK